MEAVYASETLMSTLESAQRYYPEVEHRLPTRRSCSFKKIPRAKSWEREIIGITWQTYVASVGSPRCEGILRGHPVL
jgi:hypothetical protein